MNNNVEIRNISFFKKVWYSITKFEKYPDMAIEGFGKAFKYLIILCSFVTVFIAIGTTISMRNIVFKLADYIQNNVPEFSYENGNLHMEVSEPIIIEDIPYDGIDRIIINPTIENEEDKLSFQKQNDKNGITIYFFKNQIIIRTKTDGVEANISPYTYQDFIQSYVGESIETFNKSQLIDYMHSSGMNRFYLSYFMSAFLSLLIVDIFVTAVDVLEIAIFGWITTIITRIKIKFVAIYNMSIYAITLSTLLNIIYIIINIFTTFTISYFQIAYITLAYIYLATVIFLLKDDLIKRLQEVERIKKEQEKVRQEIEREEEEKEPPAQPRKPLAPEEEKKEDENNGGEETNSSQA